MKTFTGHVVSTKGKQTAIVLVKTQYQHPLYKKTIKKVKKYLVHDEIGVKEGQRVSIIESRPLSKRKYFKIKKVFKK